MWAKFTSSSGGLRTGISLGLLALVCLRSAAQQAPQDDVPLAPSRVLSSEAYRIRIENMTQGGISLSADGGRHYTLIGRVTRPATSVLVDRSASIPGVALRSSGDGIAFAVSLGQILKLLPSALTTTAEKRGWMPTSSDTGNIVTNIAPRTSIFADLKPPSGVPVKLEIAPRTLRPFPTLYTPQQDEPIVIVVPRSNEKTDEAGIRNQGNSGREDTGTKPESNRPSPDMSDQAISQRIATLGQEYLALSLQRARQEHRPIVSGVLSLKAKLPANEPDPIAFVTYVIDNQIVSSQNVPPFNFEWDTRHEAEGEHLVEVRAANRNNHVITSKQTLLVVQNKTK